MSVESLPEPSAVDGSNASAESTSNVVRDTGAIGATADLALARWRAAERRLQDVLTAPERVRARIEADYWHEMYRAAVKQEHDDRQDNLEAPVVAR